MRVRRRLLSLVLCPALLLALQTAAAAPVPFTLDTSHTTVYFAVAHFDISPVRGRFTKLAGSVRFDPDDNTGSIDIRIDPGSIDTGNRTLDQILRSDQYLDAAQYGDVRYTGDRFVVEGGKLVAIDGTLLLHGVAKPMRLTAQRFVCKEVAAGLLRRYVCGGEFRTVFRRSDFAMTRFLPDVGDQVELTIGVEASRD